MKKTFIKVIAFMLMATLVLSLSGCGLSDEGVRSAKDAYEAVSYIDKSLDTGMNPNEYAAAVDRANIKVDALKTSDDAQYMEEFIGELDLAMDEYIAGDYAWDEGDSDALQDCWYSAEAHVDNAREILPKN